MEARKSTKKNKFQGYPRGWFVIGASDGIRPGEVQRMKYFGQQLVAFRGQTGELSVLDAYCPHLGADLGIGKVVDGKLQCAFHHWEFDGKGKCVHIPYSDDSRIPKKAVTRTWPVDEVNGLIYIWHDPQGKEPNFHIPVLEGHGTPEWTPWRLNMVNIKTHPREIVENVVDKGHFGPVHGTMVDKFENEFIDHMAIQRTQGIAYPLGGGIDKFKITATYYGPACQYSEMEGVLRTRLVNAHTPVEENSLNLFFGVTIKVKGVDPKMLDRIADAYIDNLRNGFHQDIAIWEHKMFREVPVLCVDDGPIMKLRNWYSQFYQPA